MKHLAKKHVLWLLAAALMAAFLYWGREDLGRIKTLDPLYVAICFGCTAGIAVVAVLKWKISLKSIGETGVTDFRTLFYYFMFGRAVGLVLPMDLSDFGVRTMSLKYGHAVPIGKASYSVYLDRTLDVVVAGLFVVPSVLWIVGAIQAATGLMLFGAAFILGLICFTFFAGRTMAVIACIFRALLRVACRIPWVRRRVEFDAESRVLAGESLEGIAPWLYLLSGAKFLLTSMRFMAIGLAVGLGLGVREILLFMPGAQFAAFFALTPGGLGIADWSWSGLLYKIGADKHIIVPYLVSLRLVVSLSIIVIAGFSRLLYRKPREE